MKIALIAGNWGGGPPNGIDRYVMDLTRNLVQYGHICHLIYSRLKGPWLSQDIPFAGVHQVEGLHAHVNATETLVSQRLLQALQQIKPDVVYFNTFNHHVALTTLLAEYPTLGMLHDYLPICLKDTRRNYFSSKLCQAPLGTACLLRGHFIRKPEQGRRLPRLADWSNAKKLVAVLKQVPTLLVASHAVKEAYRQNGFQESRIRVLPYFTVPPSFDIDKSYPREKLVLFVGRLTDRYKGADVLLSAVAQCHESFRLAIVGDGAFKQQVCKLVDRWRLNQRVDFHGWAGSDQVHDFYRQASVFVMPSLWAEPFGLVGVEALANGTPAVAFDVGGVSEWLQHGHNGYLVPYKNEKALAEKIDLLIRSPFLVERLGRAGRESVISRFNAVDYIKKITALFEECRSVKMGMAHEN